MYLNDEEQRGYDARKHPEMWGPSYLDGDIDFQRGWDLAAGEERRERARKEEMEAEKHYIEQQLINAHEEQFQSAMQQEMIEQETHNEN